MKKSLETNIDGVIINKPNYIDLPKYNSNDEYFQYNISVNFIGIDYDCTKSGLLSTVIKNNGRIIFNDNIFKFVLLFIKSLSYKLRFRKIKLLRNEFNTESLCLLVGLNILNTLKIMGFLLSTFMVILVILFGIIYNILC